MKNNNEHGEVVVEATILLPIAILCVILLLYVSIFICQKSILQSSLETTAVYFKNTLTDHYLKQTAVLEESEESDGIRHTGNSYSVDRPLNPYGKFFIGKNQRTTQEQFETYFESVKKSMVFDENVKLSIDYSNWILFKEIRLSAQQEIELPIDFSIIGIDNTMHLSAATKVAVTDHDELIRNIDYAVDLVEDTKIGELWKNAGDKIGEFYNKLKEKLTSN